MNIKEEKDFLHKYMYYHPKAHAANMLTYELHTKGITLNTPVAILLRKLASEKMVDVLDTKYRWKLYKISFDGIATFETTGETSEVKKASTEISNPLSSVFNSAGLGKCEDLLIYMDIIDDNGECIMKQRKAKSPVLAVINALMLKKNLFNGKKEYDSKTLLPLFEERLKIKWSGKNRETTNSPDYTKHKAKASRWVQINCE